jgi:hypothetical protein
LHAAPRDRIRHAAFGGQPKNEIPDDHRPSTFGLRRLVYPARPELRGELRRVAAFQRQPGPGVKRQSIRVPAHAVKFVSGAAYKKSGATFSSLAAPNVAFTTADPQRYP